MSSWREFMPAKFQRSSLEESARVLASSYSALLRKLREQGRRLNEQEEELGWLRGLVVERDEVIAELRACVGPAAAVLSVAPVVGQAALLAAAFNENGVSESV